MSYRGGVGVLLVVFLAACQPAKTPSQECRRQNAWKRFGRSTHPDPKLDALEDLRCDEMEREERREAREDRQREEDRQERAQARQEMVAALGPKAVAAPAPTAPVEAPDLNGMWVGEYGPDVLEQILIEHNEGRVFAYKITGDPNVPAGKPTFRAKLNGLVGDGAGHIADTGYQNPRWIPGRLTIIGPNVIQFEWAGVGPVVLRRMKQN